MRSLSELIFPSRCIGCSQLGISICSVCRSSWHPHIYYRELLISGNSYPVISAVPYSPIASKVLLGAKESNLAAADNLLIKAISHSLTFFIKKYGSGDLIGIPSRNSATRKRGRNFMVEITNSVAETNSLVSRDILKHIRSVRDQSQLDLAQRSQNIAGAFAVSTGSTKAAEIGNIRPLIIVDDLITSGATLVEAIRALRAAGFPVIGAVTGSVAKPLR